MIMMMMIIIMMMMTMMMIEFKKQKLPSQGWKEQVLLEPTMLGGGAPAFVTVSGDLKIIIVT